MQALEELSAFSLKCIYAAFIHTYPIYLALGLWLLPIIIVINNMLHAAAATACISMLCLHHVTNYSLNFTT